MLRRKRIQVATLLLLALALLVSPSLTTTATQASDEATNTDSTTAAKFLGNLDTAAVVSKNAPTTRVFAKSYVLLDSQSTNILASKNPTATIPVASTTKMMTALVARKHFSLDEVVTVPTEILQVGGSEIHLVVNEKITVHDLLRGLLIQSGNDAAFALAFHFNGKFKGNAEADYLPFVAEMNKMALELNLPSSVYRDPAGLSDEGRSTALDLAHTARLLLKDPVLEKIVNTPNSTVSSIDGRYQHVLKNSNRLIVPTEPLYMPLAGGVKTGFTPDAGHCLVSSYTVDGRTLIGVVLNTDEYTITASAKEMRKLFEWASRNVTVLNY